MIIGISGKKQHGKNTFASVMQYLIWKWKAENDPTYKGHLSYTLRDFLALDMSAASGWKQVLWAEKLKQVVCLMIGCTREKLEDNDFKETPLGEEWRRWFWSYYKGANSENPTGRVSKYFATEAEAISYKKSLVGFSEIADSLASELLTPRKILQNVGTDGGRNMVHPNIWINATLADYKGEFGGHGMTEHDLTLIYPNWIIADTRFPNEVEAIHRKGGLVFRVVREDKEPSGDEHESETALDNYKDFNGIFIRTYSGIDDDYVEAVKLTLQAHKLLPK